MNRPAEASPSWLAVIVAVAALAGAAFFWLADGYPNYSIARAGGGVIAVLSLLLIRGRRELLLAPLLWCGFIFFVGFVLSPQIFLIVEEWWPLWVLADVRLAPRALAYAGSVAEGFMLQAALACFGAFAAFAALVSVRKPVPLVLQLPLSPWVLAGVGIAASLAHGFRLGPADATLPVIMLAIAALCFPTAKDAAASRWALVTVLVAGIAAAVVNGESKFPVIMLAMPALTGFIRRGMSLPVTVCVAAAAVLAVTVPIGLSQYNAPRIGEPYSWKIDRIARGKLLVRQDETAHCLNKVVERHWHNGNSHSLGVLMSALVPRALWPDKPQVSDGMFYATEYCGHIFDPWDIKTQSSSLTVLGEPVIEDGRAGAFNGMLIILALGLAVSVVAGLVPGGAVFALAMFAWMVDVDQNFAMYLARSVKAALVMASVAAVAAWVCRIWRRI